MNKPAPAFAFLLAAALLVPHPAPAADSAAGAYEKGIERYVAEDYKSAQKAFEQAVRAEPGNADYHVWLGRAYGRRAETNSGLKILSSYGLARKARASFQRAVDLDGENGGALESLFRYYLEAPPIVGGSVPQALAVARRIEAVDRAAGARARAAYHEAKKDFSAAEAALEKARALQPDDSGHLLGHASFLARRGRFAEADELFDEAFRRDPDNPAVWLSRAKASIAAKRESAYDEARALLRRYLAVPLTGPDAEPYSNVRKLLKGI